MMPMKCCGFISVSPFFTAVSLLLFFLSSCATKSRIDPQIVSAVTSHNVAPTTAAKIQSGQVLNYSDIRHLVRAKVPTSLLIAYLQSTEKSYQFSPGQLDSLRKLGASSQLVNYLNETRGFYVNGSPCPPSQFNRKSRKNSRRNSHPSAVTVQFPGDIVDPAYEESLFSPFR